MQSCQTTRTFGPVPFSTLDLSMMSNPCECCQVKMKFIRKINGNYMHSIVIPEWFANYFGGKIPGTVKLEAPNGIAYDVGVMEEMNRAILKSGWAAFVDANQIEENYSLMFRYLGNARFKVTIFDSNGKENALCCEMKAASDMQTPNSRYVDNSSSSRDVNTQSSSGEGSDSDGCPKESSHHYFKSANKPALSFTSEEFSVDNPSADESLALDDLQMLPKDCILSGRCALTVAQKAQIHALRAEIQPKIPVFVLLIKKSNVEPHTIVVIRKDYALAFLPRESKTITLQVPRNSFEWPCSLFIRRDGGCNLRLGNYFVRDNRVREGDICIFQPMSKVKVGKFIVMVHVLHKASIGHSPGGRTNIVSNNKRTSTNIASTARVKEEPATDGEDISSSGYEDHGSFDNSEGASEPPFILPDGTRLTQAQEKKVLEKVSAIESELPIYTAVMNKTSVRHCDRSPYLGIGRRYVSTYLIKKYATGHHEKRRVISLVLQREGKSRTWDTELRCTSRRMWISKGWSSFTRVNSLREDDICLFKLMENEEPRKMMVYIIRREKCVSLRHE